MKNILRIIGNVFLWLIYLVISGKDRQKYQHAKFTRRHVIDVKNDAFGSTYTLGKPLKANEEPERAFMTWKEFRKAHNF